MSTVSNPYTFNIKSNCGFSTNTLLSNNQVKITMKYSSSIESDDHGEEYDTISLLYYNKNSGSMTPNIINGITIFLIGIQYSNIYNMDTFEVDVRITSSTKYSKIILNGGPFKNCSIAYLLSDSFNSNNHYYIEECSKVDTDAFKWKQNYDNVPFDLTIEFVE